MSDVDLQGRPIRLDRQWLPCPCGVEAVRHRTWTDDDTTVHEFLCAAHDGASLLALVTGIHDAADPRCDQCCNRHPGGAS